MSYNNMRTKRVKGRPPHTPLIECCSPATCRSQIGDVVADCQCFVPTLPSDGGPVDTGLGGYGRYLDICVRTPETTIATPAVTSWRDSQNLAPDAADSDTTSSDQ